MDKCLQRLHIRLNNSAGMMQTFKNIDCCTATGPLDRQTYYLNHFDTELEAWQEAVFSSVVDI